MAFVRIGDVSLHYQLRKAQAAGDGRRHTVVFINSLGTDFRIWEPMLAQMGNAVDCLLFDKRGHGLSELGSQPHRIETYANDLARLMTGLGIGAATICGLSIGGLIAQALYKARPDLVANLILCDTAARIGSHESWNDRIEAIRNNGLASITDGVMEKWFTPDFHARRATELAGYKVMLERQSVAGYVAACEALREADLVADAARIACPTLVVVGDQDGSTPPDLVRSFAQGIPGARFELIGQAGHIPCVEQPAALAALAQDFVSGATAGNRKQ